MELFVKSISKENPLVLTSQVNGIDKGVRSLSISDLKASEKGGVWVSPDLSGEEKSKEHKVMFIVLLSLDDKGAAFRCISKGKKKEEGGGFSNFSDESVMYCSFADAKEERILKVYSKVLKPKRDSDFTVNSSLLTTDGGVNVKKKIISFNSIFLTLPGFKCSLPTKKRGLVVLDVLADLGPFKFEASNARLVRYSQEGAGAVPRYDVVMLVYRPDD